MQRVPTIVTGVLSAVSSAPLFKKHKLDELVRYSGRTDKKLYVHFVW
jgi:hypothetical protein